MEAMRVKDVICSLVFFWFWTSIEGLLSPKGVNFEVQALMGVKASLKDPHGVLDNWDGDSVDPCSWTMITCSSESLVIGLGSPSQSLSGTLSPSIGSLTCLQIVLLQNNNISGAIPLEIGNLSKLQTLDLSDNKFTGIVPSTLGNLKSLQYLRLNNNSLSGPFPLSLANMSQITLLDLSYNNLSGPVPKFPAKTFSIIGNPLICATGTEEGCYGTVPMPNPSTTNNSQGSVLGCTCLLILGFGILLWWKHKRMKQIFFDVKRIQQDKNLDTLVDKDLKNNYDKIELEEMVQVALLCTQYLPGRRPKMSEVVRMLEGDGLVERWEASKRDEPTKSTAAHEFSSSERFSDLTDDSSLLVQAMELSGPR
ncbi:hypothetical protein IFM89_013848 [Coptis chinensis]|uniref:Leucine-rich repeat-containing N-terminal plant-type domain-containing protein n=1 Tax=Coptis chinensis TaxID=261450 RepID=A0A835IYU8_9MAGN|nr:hypothetical protein IFM89_013848 [Coptis chinensis]